MGLIFLKERTSLPELMDAPDLNPRAHAQALAGLRRLNRVSRAVTQVARPIARLARLRELTRLTVLDVACGGGDVAVGVARVLRSAGVEVELTLTDMSAVALQRAAALAGEAGVAARTVIGSAPDKLPQGEFDVVMSTLFLHHLTRGDVVGTLRQMNVRARRIVVVSDLRRSTVGYVLAWVMSRLLSRSRIVHYDGPVSVRGAWSLEEMRAMAREAGLQAEVRGCFPARIMVVGEKSG